jgi:hypothetical protein
MVIQFLALHPTTPISAYPQLLVRIGCLLFMMIYVANGHIRGIKQLNFTNGLRSKHPPIAEFSNFLPRTATC